MSGDTMIHATRRSRSWDYDGGVGCNSLDNFIAAVALKCEISSDLYKVKIGINANI